MDERPVRKSFNSCAQACGDVRVYVHMSACRSMCAHAHVLSHIIKVSRGEMFGSMQELPHADLGNVSPENGALIIVEAQIV